VATVSREALEMREASSELLLMISVTVEMVF
jgi:hypothetical protein